jgi:hypothetical protein
VVEGEGPGVVVEVGAGSASKQSAGRTRRHRLRLPALNVENAENWARSAAAFVPTFAFLSCPPGIGGGLRFGVRCNWDSFDVGDYQDGWRVGGPIRN